MEQPTIIKVEQLTCPKCAYSWYSKIIQGKRYYTCPMCKFQFRPIELQ